jgi:hypothetical protein
MSAMAPTEQKVVYWAIPPITKPSPAPTTMARMFGVSPRNVIIAGFHSSTRAADQKFPTGMLRQRGGNLIEERHEI